MDNRILDILLALRDAYGEGIFYNLTTTRNLLSDLAPHMRKERIQVMHFLEMGGLFPLKYAEKEYEIVRKRLHKQFVGTFSVTKEVAHWVLDIFSHLCGIDLEAEKNAYKPPLTPTSKPLIGDKPAGKPSAAKPTGIPPAAAKPPRRKKPAPAPPEAAPRAPVLLLPPRRPLSPPYNPRVRFAAATHTLAVTKDGFVQAAGPNTDGQCNTYTYGWRDMAAVSAGSNFTIGLRNDGTLISTGCNAFNQRDIEHWREVVQISAGVRHTAALRADGTVLAVGQNKHGECNVRHWRNIIRVIAGNGCTFGIKKEGRVLVAGKNQRGDLKTSHLNGVTDIAYGGPGRALALLSDGRVARVGQENHMQRSFTLYKNIKQIAAAPDYFAGLMENGTVTLLAYFWNECGIENATAQWRNITAIAAGRYHILGLQGNKLVGAMLHPDKSKNQGQLNIHKWEM